MMGWTMIDWTCKKEDEKAMNNQERTWQEIAVHFSFFFLRFHTQSARGFSTSVSFPRLPYHSLVYRNKSH